MFRLLFRILAILALAGGFVALVVDGTRSIAAGEISMAGFGEVLQQALGPKFATLQPALARLTPLLWDPVALKVLATPLWIVLILLGIFLVLATRRREPKIGFSSRP